MNRKACVALIAASVLTASCESSEGASYEAEEYQTAGDDELEESANEAETKGGETYAQYDDRRDGLDGSAGSFGSYGCTEDCSGHEAGYSWAEEQGIEDPDECGGKSWSFEEGCREYAEDQQLEQDEQEY